jgi:hypothetical protein
LGLPSTSEVDSLPSGSVPPAASQWKAYHCMRPPPTSLLTKYCRLPKNTRYLQTERRPQDLDDTKSFYQCASIHHQRADQNAGAPVIGQESGRPNALLTSIYTAAAGQVPHAILRGEWLVCCQDISVSLPCCGPYPTVSMSAGVKSAIPV